MVCSSICGGVEWVREEDCHRWGADQYGNVGTWDVFCRVVFEELQWAACLSCFLKAAAVDVCEVSPQL